jgi:uncharacterized protein (DUF2461 family)
MPFFQERKKVMVGQLYYCFFLALPFSLGAWWLPSADRRDEVKGIKP